MASGLPPPPVNDDPGSFTWMEWYRQLRNYVSTSGSVPWYIINFSGSNIIDIAQRSHNQLQTLQGGSANERYHLSASQYSRINNYCDVQTTTSGIALPTTPTIIKPVTTVTSNGITYDSSTGIYTMVNGGTYSLNITLNATPSASNKVIYFYAEEDTGSGWQIKRYSARQRRLTVSLEEQTVFSASIYFNPGTKTRHYIWADATVTLNSVDLPGTIAGTVTVPALRVSWEGGL